jgi:hypothetical protein
MLLSLRRVFSSPSMVGLLIATVVLVGLLIVPCPGPLKASVLLGLVGVCQGVLIRRDELASTRPAAWVVLGLLTLPVMLLAMVPWVVMRGSGGMSPPPALVWPGVAILAAVLVVLPLLLVVLWSPRRLEVLRSLAWHPLATLLVLAVVPFGLIAAEVLGVLVSCWLGWFAFYVVDLFPNTLKIVQKYGIYSAIFNNVYFVELNHLNLYGHHLAHGMPLSSALPVSLGQPRHAYDGPWTIETGDVAYLLVRAAHTAVIVFVWLVALTLQAHWLAQVARLELRRRPVEARPTTAGAEAS